MSLESTPNYEYKPNDPITLDYPIQERTRPLDERPLAQLGDLVILTVMGGVLSGGGVGAMPHVEALVLEGTAATTEIPERLAA